MKKFLLKVLGFFGFFTFIGLLVLLGDRFILNSNVFWKLPGNTENVILGHSHPECAFNDSIIPNFKNLGASGEAYLYTYIKLKKIIQNNEQVKTVFIEFGTNNVKKNMDEWIWDIKSISGHFPMYFSTLELPELAVVWNNGATDLFKISFKRYIKEIGYHYYSLFFEKGGVVSDKKKYGGYRYLIRNKTDSLINARLVENKVFKPIDERISNTNIHYLKKMLELCQQYQIKPILVRCPVHEFYSNPNEEENFRNILNSNFSDVVFIDFEKFPLENDFYGDFGHLNYKGAKVFSEWFSYMLNNGLLYKEDKQGFIDNEINLLKNNTCMFKQDSLKNEI